MISVGNVVLPNKPLSNYDIIEAIKELKIPGFRGVFLRDQLPNRPRKKECGIINLADSDDSIGTHWVAYYKNIDLKIYFDSYGFPPPLELIYYLKDVTKSNIYQIQPNNTVICGHLCLYVLKSLVKDKGNDFNDIILELLP